MDTKTKARQWLLRRNRTTIHYMNRLVVKEWGDILTSHSDSHILLRKAGVGGGEIETVDTPPHQGLTTVAGLLARAWATQTVEQPPWTAVPK